MLYSWFCNGPIFMEHAVQIAVLHGMAVVERTLEMAWKKGARYAPDFPAGGR